MKQIIILAMIASVCSIAAGDVLWVGGTDSDFYNEANWTDTATSLAPAAGTINPATALTGGETYIMENATANFNLGRLDLNNAGTTLTLNNATLTGFTGVAGPGTFNLLNNSFYSAAFITDFSSRLIANVDGTSTMTLAGGANPIAGTARINLAIGAVLNLTGESVADATNEHFAKIFIGGTALSALTAGTDYTIVSNGANSSTITAIPEPATIGLMGIAGVGMMLARRKARG